jgi:hypothetical protein
MLCFAGAGSTLARVFFCQLARMTICSNQPIWDAWRLGRITVCLAIQIGNAVEVWEAVMLCAISIGAV